MKEKENQMKELENLNIEDFEKVNLGGDSLEDSK